MDSSPLPKILCIVGARPNFMKIAPVMAALQGVQPALEVKLVHTGQHYDVAMNEQFFQQLDIPRPDIALEVGSATHAVQTAEIMKRLEPVLDQQQPQAILVVGDVNSTVASALVAAKKAIPVIHVEAGLRSFDRGMPEEVNRVITDQLSELLFTTERDAINNLVREGIDPQRVHFVGNVMIDTLLASRRKAMAAEETLAAAPQPEIFTKSPNGYGILTLHRPANVDDISVLQSLLTVLREISQELPLVFPIHPRTRSKIEAFQLQELLDTPRVLALPPLGYLELLGLLDGAKLVLTDSGGLQEESTALGVPCLTLRDNTERPITLTQGTNSLVGNDAQAIWCHVREILENGGKAGQIPELWDGQAAPRIARIMADWAHGLGGS